MSRGWQNHFRHSAKLVSYSERKRAEGTHIEPEDGDGVLAGLDIAQSSALLRLAMSPWAQGERNSIRGTVQHRRC